MKRRIENEQVTPFIHFMRRKETYVELVNHMLIIPRVKHLKKD
jgi:hypothetical protein